MTPMTLSRTFSMSSTPKWATDPTAGRAHRGEAVAWVARQLGTPLMPWQQLVADVATEYDPVSGVPFYREVIVTVPRQSGKTTLLLALEVERAMRGDQRIFYSAQTGWDATRKLLDDQAPILEKSKLSHAMKRVLRGAGNVAFVFKNGSMIQPMAGTSGSGHGRVMDMGVIDEAFDDQDDRREQAMIPAMATRQDAQLFVISTAGTDQSLYFNRKVAAGRAAVMDGRTSGIAFFEWSAPDDAKTTDRELWPSFMPALGHTIDEAVVEHARLSMDEAEFRRAFMNIPTGSADTVFPEGTWERVLSDDAPQGDLMFAVDATPDLSAASIAVCDTNLRVEVVDHRDGVGWVVDRCQELFDRWGSSFVVEVSGPAGMLADRLSAAGVDVTKVRSTEVARASAEFYTRVLDAELSVRNVVCSHCGLVPISEAVRSASRQPQGDGWRWSRKKTTADISTLMAASLAVWGQTTGGEVDVQVWSV